MFKKLEIFLIKLYQKQVSSSFKGKCRMYPTCSNYALIAINRFGFCKGNFLLLKRLFVCSNFKSKKIVDHVPQNIKGEYKWLI